jgi:NAD(P)-dependent dehydrogenase (short-subunit alcohol dehydrogenase family)
MENIKGKVFLVTGGTSGVGKATAIGLAQKGARVVIISRNKLQCEQTLVEIAQRTGNDKGEYLIADLSLQSSIKAVSAQFKKKYDNLHVLANCMGAIFNEKQMTSEGVERTFAVNYMSQFGLTTELLDILKASGPSRIITVTGNPLFLRKPKIDFDDIQCLKKFNGMMASGQAMFARLFFTFELAERLKSENVTVNTFNPGVIKSKLTSNSTFFIKVLGSLFTPFQKDVCDVSTFLSTSEEVATISGKFFDKDRNIISFHETIDKSIGHRLWEYSEQLVKTV